MTFTPYEMRILLDVHCEAEPSVNTHVPLFQETVAGLIRRLLVVQKGTRLLPGPALPQLMEYVLDAPVPSAPGWREPLTAQQLRIMSFLLEHKKGCGFSPTRAEIARHFGFASDNSAQTHLAALQKKGYIRIVGGRARGIEVVA